MNIKKMMMKGSLAAILGLSLVTGGTLAAFNDVEQVQSQLAAGTLDLAVNPTVVFNVGNLKPGDWMLRDFSIRNAGTLDIEKVLMYTSFTVKDGDDNVVADARADEFADQFNLFLLTSDLQPILSGLNKSILELSHMTDLDITTYLERILFFPLRPNLPVGDNDHIIMGIDFKNILDREADGILYKQNQFQGWTIEVIFDLEATQFPGEER